MPFTGKSTYGAGAALPEILEDVADIIAIVSPHETPLLDQLGDPRAVATSTVHEWIEDALLPNTDAINQSSFTPDALTETDITVDNADRFQVGDQVKAQGSGEVMLVTAVSAPTITVTRGYGGTAAEAIADDQVLSILGNAALEGADAAAARFTSRVRRQNYAQIFAATVEVSGTQQAVNAIGVENELDYQKQERLRELLRDLENCVINGVAPASTPEGSASVRRTMNGIIPSLTTNVFEPGVGGMPDGSGTNDDELNEALLNAALRAVWEQSSGTIDTIVVNGVQKRKLNRFTADSRSYMPDDRTFSNMIGVYESDFGVCRIVVSRHVPSDALLMLDSSRVQVLPIAGRSFHFKPLAATGDAHVGQVVGEYTLELRNESAHAVITNLLDTDD